jgi:hypothetical protein
MAKQPKQTPTPIPQPGASQAEWHAYWAAVEPTEAQKAEVHERARTEAVRLDRERRDNAFPVLTDQVVRADVGFWRGHDARVVRDDGPARDGTRTIEIARLHGPRAGEKIAVRRDRVSLVPGVTGHSAAAGR